jgi:Polysaccharide pyruvyl transferase
MLKFSSFKYDHSRNLGDEIQSLAAEQYLPRIDKYFDRDSLRSIKNEEKHLLIMNGWFSHYPEQCFPPADFIEPIFIGFHMTNINNTVNEFLSPEGVKYFERYEPIGCRDKHTMELLTGKGIKSFYSKCLSITFPKRKIKPKKGKVFVVDTGYILLPDFLHKDTILISHITSKNYEHEIKMQMARELLRLYRDEARLVITTRLHCALPCIGMGIPVIFFGNPKDYRLSVLEDLGIKINKLPNRWVSRVYKLVKIIFLDKLFTKLTIKIIYKNVDWDPQSISIEKEKEELTKITKELLRNKINELKSMKR